MRLLLIIFTIIGILPVNALRYVRIFPAGNPEKSLFIQNSSLDNNASIILWTETDVQAQQWEITISHGKATFRNLYTGKFLCIKDDKAVQSDTPYAWELKHTRNKEYTILTGKKILSPTSQEDGSEIILTENGSASWNIEEVKDVHTGFDTVLRQRMADGFFSQFQKQKGHGFATFNNGSWFESETMEAVLDVYETTGEERYFDIFKSCYDYFKHNVGDVWTGGSNSKQYEWFGNDFNDDVMWQVIGAARATKLTGDRRFVEDAKRNFHFVLNRAFLSHTGLIRWAEKSGDRNGTNSCINGPTEVAACYIGICEADESYFELARTLYTQQRKLLYEQKTGRVLDAIVINPETGEIVKTNNWASTYNQGTMLGAATLLYQHYRDTLYRNDARKIIAFAQKNLCDSNGIIRVCQNVDGDFQGFKGILMRYAGLYARIIDDKDVREWIIKNAWHAYNNSNTRHITHSAWQTKSSENNLYKDIDYSNQAFGASTCISAAFAIPLMGH